MEKIWILIQELYFALELRIYEEELVLWVFKMGDFFAMIFTESQDIDAID